MLSIETPSEVAESLARRVRETRLRANWSRATLAARSGVSQGSLIRFERSGRISLQNLLGLALALGHLEDFNQLFRGEEVESIAELEQQVSAKKRQRGRR